MPKFKIYAGLSGGFGGAEYINTEEFNSKEEAFKYAYEIACDEYEVYVGFHGLRDYDEILDDLIEQANGEYEVTVDDVFNVYCDERESWLDFDVKEVLDGEDDEEVE